MSQHDVEITRIHEVRGRDGSQHYEVHGGKDGQGGTSFFIEKQTFHELEKQGKGELNETLKRVMQSTLDGRGQPLE